MAGSLLSLSSAQAQQASTSRAALAASQPKTVNAAGYAALLTNGVVASSHIKTTAQARTSAAPLRMAGVGASYGNQSYNLVFSSGDVAGSMTRISAATFNAMTPAQLRASYDVLLFTWATGAGLNADWNTRLLPYLNAGGHVIWEDDSNMSDLAPELTGGGYYSGSPYTVASVPGLTAAPGVAISNVLTYAHFTIGSYSSRLHPFITAAGATIGAYGSYSGGGRMVITGDDQDYHEHRGSNGYNLMVNILNWVGAGSCTGPAVVTRPVSLTLDALGNAVLTPAAVDNGSTTPCGLQSMTLSKTTFNCANVGLNTVVLTVRDTQGNASTGTATVTVRDATAPTAIAQNLTVQLGSSGTVSVAASQVNNGSSDNCSVASIGVSPSNFTCANLGPNLVTLTVTDASGNVSTASANVTVVDNSLPTITAPANMAVGTDATTCTATGVALGTPVTADNCTVASVTNDAPAAFPKGITTVTWTAADAAGNVATATQTVTVTDNILPTITAPAAVSVSTDPGQCSATSVLLGTATAADNCSAVVTNDAPATFAKGATTVTWTATDASGNIATATQVVTVTDTEKPTISAPAAMAVSTDAGQCAATGVNLGTATAGDNCTGVVVSNDAPATFPKGTTTVTWTATDAAGLTATATQLVTVNDNELPTITAPATVTVSTNAGQCSATGVALGNATAGDNCTGAVVSNNAPATFPKGVTTVTWTATDASGNVATATQLVTVNDTERPVLGSLANLSVSAPATQCGAAVTFAPTATDNCAGATVVASPASGSTFPVGTSTVTVTATDASGNTSTGSFTVTVNDVTAPAVAVRNVSVTLSNGAASVTAAAVNYGSTDACGIASVVLSRTSFDCSNIGANNVTLTVTDIHGNVASAPAVVTVVGSIPVPTILATPSSVYVGGRPTIYLGYGSQSATLTASGGASYQWAPASGLTNTSSAAALFTPTAPGMYTFTVTATSTTGCTATTSVKVYVEDVRCSNNSNNDKVTICHNGHEICVSTSALNAHLAHGDKVGMCSPPARPTAVATTELVFEAYPNPFGASTTVHFRPAVSAAAQIRVFDSVGRVVGTLFSGTTEAGHDYVLSLDGTPLAAGLYLCRYESQGQVHTQRLSVVK